MRPSVVLVLLLSSLAAVGPAVGEGVATNAGGVPVHLYLGRLAPGAMDEFPGANTYFDCATGSQASGPGSTVNLRVRGLEPGDTAVLHTLARMPYYARVETILTPEEPQASASTLDLTSGCPMFAVESRARSADITYVAVTCWPRTVCPPLWP